MSRSRLPRSRLIGATLEMLASGVGDLKPSGPLGLHRADQALVLELGERRVNRARAGTPEPFAALLDRLHQLIAVAGLLGDQAQDRQPDVAPAGPPAPAPVRAPA